MQNLWSELEAQNYKSDLALRVYTSNLLGRSSELVLHGGGNTSVKSVVSEEEILFVKGSGWDLVSIKEEGFAPVRLEALKNMAKLERLSDSDMVSAQKEAMINKSAPNPSVEAILHAIIPFKYVDHTHADAVVTISNSVNGQKHIEELYKNFLIVPYVMPGFILAQKIFKMTKELDWSQCEGIILHNHGIFTFSDDAKEAYLKMIDAVSLAERFLDTNAPLELKESVDVREFDVNTLKSLLEEKKGHELFLNINQSPLALTYAANESLQDFATRGVLTPEHIIRTKRWPLILKEGGEMQKSVQKYEESYLEYFKKFAKDEVMLNPAPNYAVVENFGVISFGESQKKADIIADIIAHTMSAVLRADELGGYRSISLKDSFDMEYWELEQAKLKK